MEYPDQTDVYFGEMKHTGNIQDFDSVIEKYFGKTLWDLAFSLTWGGYLPNDVQIAKDLGLGYGVYKTSNTYGKSTYYEYLDYEFTECDEILQMKALTECLKRICLPKDILSSDVSLKIIICYTFLNHNIFKEVTMNIEQAVELIYTGLVSEESVPVKLRAYHELDRELLAQVQEALDFAIEYYKGEPLIPKKLAAALVDIYGAFYFNSGFSENELRELEDIGMDLQEKSIELFED